MTLNDKHHRFFFTIFSLFQMLKINNFHKNSEYIDILFEFELGRRDHLWEVILKPNPADLKGYCWLFSCSRKTADGALAPYVMLGIAGCMQDK